MISGHATPLVEADRWQYETVATNNPVRRVVFDLSVLFLHSRAAFAWLEDPDAVVRVLILWCQRTRWCGTGGCSKSKRSSSTEAPALQRCLPLLPRERIASRANSWEGSIAKRACPGKSVHVDPASQSRVGWH